MNPTGLAAHLPALQVVLPLLAAPVCLLIGKPRFCWLLAFAVTLACFAISQLLLGQVLESGTIHYAMGG